MIIDAISIKNFQTYYGNIEFEFVNQQMIKYSIGGLNGAGKTSFFQVLFWIYW